MIYARDLNWHILRKTIIYRIMVAFALIDSYWIGILVHLGLYCKKFILVEMRQDKQ